MRGSPLDLAALRLASTRGFEWLRLSRGYKRAGEGLAPSIPRRFCDAGTARPVAECAALVGGGGNGGDHPSEDRPSTRCHGTSQRTAPIWHPLL